MTEGDFFGGKRVRLFGNAAWQPSPRFRTSLGYNINDIDLPQGRFHTRILSTGFDVVMVNGRTVVWKDMVTNELPGKAIRGPGYNPALASKPTPKEEKKEEAK